MLTYHSMQFLMHAHHMICGRPYHTTIHHDVSESLRVKLELLKLVGEHTSDHRSLS